MRALDLLNDPLGDERGAPRLPSPMEISDRTGSMEDEREKENLCSVQLDNLGTSTKKKRNQKSRGFNLRKSLAWNKAFFTEEGVLDPMELSVLSKSSTKSSGSLASVGEMSPLTMYSKSSIRPPLHDLATNSQSKNSKPRKLFSSSNEEPESHITSGTTPSTKGVFRNIPRSPATYSQKRAANASTTNPTSKLPKFMPTKSHVPPPSSRKVMLITKSSKSDRPAIKGNVGQNSCVRQPHAKMDVACSSSSSNPSAGNHEKHIVESCSTSLKSISSRPSLGKHEIVTCGPGKIASIPQCINHVGGPPAPVHARPSALRMPTPSLGFFCQGKVSPSSNYLHQRHTQTTESNIPSLRQPMNLNQNLQLQPATAVARKQPMKGTLAANSGPASGISTSSQACLAARDSHHPTVTNTEVKQSDRVGRRISIYLEGSCQKDSEEQSGYDRLFVGQDKRKQPGSSLVEKPAVDRLKELYCGDRSSKISNASFIQGTQQSPRNNIPNDHCNASPPIEDSNGSHPSCSNGSRVDREGCYSKEVQGSSWVDGLARNSHNNLNETFPIIIENSQSNGNSDVLSKLESDTMPIVFADSIEHKESLKEDILGYFLTKDVEPDRSVSPRSGMCGQVTTPGNACIRSGLNGAVAEKCQPTHSEERELQDCGLLCDSTNAMITNKPDSLMPRDKLCNDTSRQDVLLNVVPFSDEWVAALEALGEDVLEKKTGRVQNSPPDKALPEPGPWSPVKKKAQDIGPYDCTKYTKNLTTSDIH